MPAGKLFQMTMTIAVHVSCMSMQMTQGKVTYMSEVEDGRRRHLVADTDITSGTWHNVTLIVSG